MPTASSATAPRSTARPPVKVSNLTNVVAIAAGFFHSLAIKSDGSVWAWGLNSTGQLGNNTIVNSNVPVQMQATLSGTTAKIAGATAIAGGSGHSLILTSASGLLAVGNNGSGQLGINNLAVVSNMVAIPVTPAITGVTSIAAGRNHSLALTTGGKVYAWGDNSTGQLGDGTTTNQKAPEPNATLTAITQISSRDSTSLGLDTSGAVWCWGRNDVGQCATGSTASPQTTPVTSNVSGFVISSMSSGGFHSVAISTASNQYLGWGDSSSGQLADIPPTSNVAATGLGSVTGVSKLAAGYTFTLGLKPDGSVIAFGANGSGQLGDGTTVERLAAVNVLGVGGTGLLNLAGLYSLSVTVTGGGSVTSSPAGVTCSSGTCAGTFNSGTVVTLTAAAASGNTFTGWGGACSGALTTCNVTVGGATSVTASFTGASSGPAISVVPDTGYWWNPAEPGRGFVIEQNNGKIFFASFLYEFSGRASWYGSGPTAYSGSTYAGVLNLYANGQTLTGAYQPSTQVGGTFGNVSINFTSTTTGTMTWPGGTTPIQRFDIVTGGSAATPPDGTPQRGYWWNPNEAGRGFSIEIQNGTMLVAGYMYDANGNPIWYLSQGPMASASLYQGTWVQNGFGQTLTGAYHAASVVNSNVGALTIQFSSATAGTMTLPDGRQIPIQRFGF
ncbi:MAG: hypothetical protein WDN04_01495 [Rhodospirillales bacterium]